MNVPQETEIGAFQLKDHFTMVLHHLVLALGKMVQQVLICALHYLLPFYQYLHMHQLLKSPLQH